MTSGLIKKLKVAITGAAGQVGSEISRAPGASDFDLTLLGRSDLDVSDRSAVFDAIATIRPRLVINAAAYTAVDRAESERDAAFAVNRDGARYLAEACAKHGVGLLHISTDYVFDGNKAEAYTETDTVAPLSIYGQSKAEGEASIRGVLQDHAILRTAWVYGAAGQNFVKTMLRLGAERDVIRVVADQRGSPTAAPDIAAALMAMARRMTSDGPALSGTYHYTGRGDTTWYGFAQEIFAQAEKLGEHVPRVEPIATSQYPTAARRPMNSKLDCARFDASFASLRPAWQESLGSLMGSLLRSRRPALENQST